MRFRLAHLPVIFNKIIPPEPVGGGTPTVVSVTAPSVTEGTDLVFTVTLSNATIASTDYSYAVAPANGLGNADITGTISTFTLSDGVTKSGTTSGNFTVPIGVSSFTVTFGTVDDALYELNERVSLTVSAINGQGTITDNDPVPVVSIVPSQTALEGGTMTFSVSISSAPGRVVTVNYATSDDTATAGLDYTATSGTLSWSPGESASKTFAVAITSDLVTPEAESFNVDLSSPVACTIGLGAAIGYITDVPDPVLGSASNAFLFTDNG
ncbi:MAG: Calx-beta domain-containing protein, partial [Bacteroidota bacterium]|nr:Calx-beta domain-containing protein [Bacteroidota bacterium]